MEKVDFSYRVYDNFLEIIPDDGIKDNSIYKLRITGLKSQDQHSELPKLSLEFATAMTPSYCSLDDVKATVDVLDIPDAVILRLIRQASREADFINGKPVDTRKGIPFEIQMFTITKATYLALTRAYVVGANDSGLEGTLGKITFKNGTKLDNIHKVIDSLKDEALKWQEAIRGYKFEGRNVSKFALRANKTLRPTPVSIMLKSYTRDGNMGWDGI